jgi:hypothetical protein
MGLLLLGLKQEMGVLKTFSFFFVFTVAIAT